VFDSDAYVSRCLGDAHMPITTEYRLGVLSLVLVRSIHNA
jgi:hypothetical protein